MPDPQVQDSSNQTLSDIVRGMQHAVNEAQRMLEVHFLEVLGRYFNDDGTPKVVEFRVREDEVIRTPLITLIHPNGLHLNELDLQFAIRVQREAVKTLPNPEDMDGKRRQIEKDLTFAEEELTSYRNEISRLERELKDGIDDGEDKKEALRRCRIQVEFLERTIDELHLALQSVVSRSSVTVSFAPRSEDAGPKGDSVIDVAMKFKAQAQPEGVSRIIDEFTKTIVTSRDEATHAAILKDEFRFSVRLLEFGENKIAIIKLVRSATGIGLKEAKDLVEQAPEMVKENLSQSDARSLKAEIESAGGQAEILEHNSTEEPPPMTF